VPFEFEVDKILRMGFREQAPVKVIFIKQSTVDKIVNKNLAEHQWKL
jgi:hypothetical protein